MRMLFGVKFDYKSEAPALKMSPLQPEIEEVKSIQEEDEVEIKSIENEK